jgi:hypothetical protein
MKKITDVEAYRLAEMQNADTAWKKGRKASIRCLVPMSRFPWNYCARKIGSFMRFYKHSPSREFVVFSED